MNKIERIEAVLEGRETDRPPVCLWYHFGVQHAKGEEIARISLDYFRHYDLDWLKVMNDYFYPLPAGLEAVKSREDLKRIQPFEPEDSDWKEQLEALRIIARALKGKAFFIDTVFDAWQSLQRSLAGEHLQELMRDQEDALLQALEVVNQNLISYCRRALEAGAAGIFLSIPAAEEIMSREDFLKFSKPFAARLLQSLAGLGTMNTAHIHGDRLYFDDVLDLPVGVLSWWDRGPQGPSLEYVKESFPGCVMGGIDQTAMTRRTVAFMRDHVREAIQLGGKKRFFLAGGCSIPTWIYPGMIRAVVETAKAAARRA